MTTDVEETIVSAGAHHLMTVRHLRLRGSEVEIGAQLADIWRERHARDDQPPGSPDPLGTPAQREWAEMNWPQAYARMRGAARRFRADFEDNRHDFRSLPYGTVAAGCSCVFYPPGITANGEGILARNYDFTRGSFANFLRLPNAAASPACMADPYLFEVYPEGGYATLFMSCFDLLGGALDGVNSEGLSVALLADLDPRESGMLEPSGVLGVGLSEIAVPRFLLETCANVDEAKRSLLRTKQFYGGMPAHYLVADAAGNAFVWQHSNVRNRPRITDLGDGPLCVTNHQLDRDQPPAAEGLAESVRRLEALAGLTTSQASFDEITIRATNHAVEQRAPAGSGLYASVAPTRTLWTALWNPTRRSVAIDFYVNETGSGDSIEIERTEPLTFALS